MRTRDKARFALAARRRDGASTGTSASDQKTSAAQRKPQVNQCPAQLRSEAHRILRPFFCLIESFNTPSQRPESSMPTGCW